MKVDTSKKMLVRGRVIYTQWRASCLSLERAKDDKCHDVGVAYTPFHRHDEDPTIVETELDRLARFYMSFKEVDSLSMSFEYVEYDH